MKGRKSSSNSREGGKSRWKDKRKGNFKIKWPCVRSGPITERKGEWVRRKSGNVHRHSYTAEYRRADSCRAMSIPKRIFRLLFLFRTCLTPNDLVLSHTLCYKTRYHSCVHNCAHDKLTNQLPQALLRRARDVWIFTSTTPTPLTIWVHISTQWQI